MTLGLSAYTPLEALLLFRYLAVYGISGTVFGSISDLLKSDPVVRNAPNFEPGRLSPDALRDVFLRLLKEEARNDINNSSGHESDGHLTDGHAGSRKRKAPSPTLPTIQDALKDAHLIPQLVNKLYARYREHAVGEIREEERKYQRLRREIDGLEKGEWDLKLAEELQQGQWDDRLRWLTAALSSQTNGAPTDAHQKTKSSTAPSASLDATRRLQAPPTSSTSPAIQAAQSSQLAQPPTYSPHPQECPQGSSNPAAAHQGTPYLADPPAPRRFSPSQHAQAAHQPGNAAVVAAEHTSVLMPPPGTSPFPFANHLSTHSSNSINAPRPMPSPPAQQAPSQPSYVQYPGANQAQISGQAGYVPQQSPQYAPHRGGRQLSPFHVAAPTARTPQALSHSQVVQTGKPPLSVQAGPVFATPEQTTNRVGRQPLPAQTPVLLDQIGRLLDTPSPHHSPRTVRKLLQTPWKRDSLSQKPPKAKSPSPPLRDVSPVSDRASSPPAPSETSRKGTHHIRPRNATAPVNETNAFSARSTRAASRRARGVSAASSVVSSSVRGRTRSQSVLSHVSVDNESISGHKVKAEPATPADIRDGMHSATEDTPSSSQRPVPPLYINKRKRSLRGTSEASDTPATLHQRPSPAPRNEMIVAVRNFPRLSHSVMDSIQSHKHASLFAAPVRERDAEGYHEYIKQPQNLKSIRAAIQAGARAVNAAASDMTPIASGSTPRETGTVLLPPSEDITPPKGIVNSSQLEKEIMRMFANAVMFNPGEDELVQDAREMAESSAVSLATFRSAERTGSSVGSAAETAAGRTRRADSEVDELVDDPADVDTDSAPPPAKRKRAA